MKCSPCCRVFLGALLMVLSVDGCCGQTGDCSYQYCSHSSMRVCALGGLLRLQCIVYNAANIIQVKWYHSLNGNLTELNITTGERYIVNEAGAPSGDCTGDDWQSYELTFNYTETDSGSYLCQIVIAGNIHLDLSEPWMVNTSSSLIMICGDIGGVTDLKCVGQPTATPSLSVSSVLPQDYSTSAVGATTKPFVSETTMIHSPVETPSIPSHITAPPSTTPPLTTTAIMAPSLVETPSSSTAPSSTAPPSTTPPLTTTAIMAPSLVETPSSSTAPSSTAPPLTTPPLTTTAIMAPSLVETPSSSTAPSSTAPPSTTPPLTTTAIMAPSLVETPSSSTAPSSTAPPLTTPSSTTLPAGCTVGGTSCFVYLAAGLGVLVIIVVLLVVVVIVLVCISVGRGKRKGKGKILVADSSKTVGSYEKIELQQNPDVVVKNSLYYTGMERQEKGSHKKKDTSSKSYDYVDVDMTREDKRSSQITVIPTGTPQASVDKSTEEEMHMYDVVSQPVAGSTDQQHIYSRTQHGSIKQQTSNECHQHVTDGHEYERLNRTKLGQKGEMRVGVREYDRVSPGEQQKKLGSGNRPSQEHLYHVLEGSTEVSSSTTNATTTEDTYSTPNFERSSSTGQPQTGKEADDNEHNYDEPIHQNWPTTKLKDEVENGHGDPEVLFDDPSYQAPQMSTQPYTLSHDFSYNTKDNLLPPSSEATPVQDQGKLVRDPAYQVSTAISPARRLTASEHSRSNQKSKTDKESDTITPHTPEDEYGQPTAITATSKGSSSAEGDQSALFDDPIYSAQI